MFEFSQKQWVRFDSLNVFLLAQNGLSDCTFHRIFIFKRNQETKFRKINSFKVKLRDRNGVDPPPPQLSYHGKMCEVVVEFHFACITFWCNINNFRISFLYFVLAVSLSISATGYLLFFRRHFYLFLLLLCRCRQ